MAGKKTIAVNYLYNMSYQIVLLLTPIILTPYVVRVLGASGYGRYSFACSINSYFMLFAALGYYYYSQRLIASHQGDAHAQSVDFWELLLVRSLSVAASLLVYAWMLFAGVFPAKISLLMGILVLNVVGGGIDVSFYFQGNEAFDKLVIRNIVIRLLMILSVFVFVRESTDLWKYALINGLCSVAGPLSLWFMLRGRLTPVSIKELHPMKHFLPALLLFLPTIATSVYTSLDKTMIGVLTGLDEQNGFYEASEKVVKVLMTVVTSLGAVVIPSNTKKFADGDLEGIRRNADRSIRFVLFLGLPMSTGLFCVAGHFVPWFLGSGYEPCARLIRILCPIICIIGLSNVFGIQLLLPSKRDKRFTGAIVSGAAFNFCLNLFLIPRLLSAGAALATVAAESLITVMMFFFARDYLRVKKTLLSCVNYFLGALVMGLCIYPAGTFIRPGFAGTMLLALFGAGIYFVFLCLRRDEFLWMILAAVKGKLSSLRRGRGKKN